MIGDLTDCISLVTPSEVLVETFAPSLFLLFDGEVVVFTSLLAEFGRVSRLSDVGDEAFDVDVGVPGFGCRRCRPRCFDQVKAVDG